MHEFTYIGVLANVDDTILGVSLEDDYLFKKIPLVELLELGSKLFNRSMNVIEQDWIYPHRSIINSQLANQKASKNTNDLYCYIITKTYNVDIQLKNNQYTVDDWNKLAPLSNETAQHINTILLKKINLFKHGNVSCPIHFEYIDNNSNPIFFSSSGISSIEIIDLLSLDKGEETELSEFIKDFKLPDDDNYLSLALQNYELSYKTNIMSLSYISSVTSLEVLFDSGSTNVASGVALILEEEFEEISKTAKEVKKLHETRSELIHSGKQDKIDKDKLDKLREYNRKALLKSISLNKSKKQLINELKASGSEHDDFFK